MLKTRVPLKIATLCSHRAPGLLYLLNRDPNRGVLYDIVCCITSDETFAEEVRVERRGITCLPRPIRRFYAHRARPIADLEARAFYDAKTADALAVFSPDLILLSSYLYILTRPILAAYPHRIFSVHHADLTLMDGTGRPKYRGLHSVRDAVFAGEGETRSTVHVVTEKPDEGPPVLRSWPFRVSPLVQHARERRRTDVLRAYAFAHQEWMISVTCGPLLARTIELAATGHLRVGDESMGIGAGRQPWELREDGTLAEPGAPVERSPAPHQTAAGA